MPRTHRVLPSLALLLVLTAACGGTGETDTTTSTAPPSTAPTTAIADSDHNRSDIEFAQDMIPHHEQAVVVAELALERASSPEVKDLAQRIKDAQNPEKNALLAQLRLWGETVTPGGASGEHDHSHLMPEETFQQLQQSTGPAFDTLWLQTMIEHHQGAVDLAQAQLRDGSDTLTSMYAQDIVDRQSKEIEEMTALLGQ